MLIIAFIITFLMFFAVLPAIVILMGCREQDRHLASAQRILDDLRRPS